MSASTRTIQQPLGFGQIGAALAVVAVAIAIAALVAFGSMGAAKTDVTPAVGAPPPAVIDHGWSQAGTSTSKPAYQADPGFAPRSPDGAKSVGGRRVGVE